MPITVKHSPSAAAIGGSAYTIGRGEKQRWAAEMAQRQQALNLQAAGMVLQNERSAEQLGLRRDEFEYGQERDAADRAAAELGRATAEQRWNEEPSRQLQKGLEQQELLQKNLTWQYDEGQKKELDKITTGVAWIRSQVASGKWTAEQGEQAERQLWQKYHSIIPLPFYDDQPKPQELYNRSLVTDQTTGAQYRQKGNGDWEQVGISFKDYAALRAKVAEAFTKQITDPDNEDYGKGTTDWPAVDKFVDDTMERYAKIQGLASRAEEIQGRQQKQQAEQQQLQEQQQEQQEQEEMQAAVEALPVMFETIVKGQPKIGRIKKGKTSSDNVYGEEAYNKTLMEAAERGKQDGIPPETVKAKLDEWWDEQHDKERGEWFQKFGNRMEFEGAAPASQEEFIRTIQGMDDKAKAKTYYDKWAKKWQ